MSSPPPHGLPKLKIRTCSALWGPTGAEPADDPTRPGILRLSGNVITYYSAAEEWELLDEFESPRIVHVRGTRVVIDGEEGCELQPPRADLDGPGEVRGYELQHNPETCESIHLYASQQTRRCELFGVL